MLVSDLIRRCTFERIKEKIVLHYGENELEKYERLFNLLRKKSENEIEPDSLTIFIKAFRETDDDSIYVADFDENNPELNFDVCGFIDGEDVLYSIASADYDEFLRYKIDNKTLEKFTDENILAHCLYEVTAYGFEK